jgi:hypothetical protein
METNISKGTIEQVSDVGSSLKGISAGTTAVRMADLDFSRAATVQGIGFRFLIPIPDLGSENKVLTVKNWKGEDETIIGYPFKNATDGADQAVRGDGTGVIIVGLNPEAVSISVVARNILDTIAEFGGVDALNVSKLNQLLSHIHDTLGIKDTYNSTDKVAASMVSQAGLSAESGRPLGLYEKAEKPGPLAVFVSGACEVLDGPHAGTASYPAGFVAVMIPPKQEGGEPTFRSISPLAISYCYVLADGTRISDPESQLPVVTAQPKVD